MKYLQFKDSKNTIPKSEHKNRIAKEIIQQSKHVETELSPISPKKTSWSF